MILGLSARTISIYPNHICLKYGILPFEVYVVQHEGVCNINNPNGTSKSVISGSIPGELHSVMIIKMDGASTYDLLLRVPYETDNLYNFCSFKDLGNYKVLANDLNVEEVERMVDTEGYLNMDYMHLIYDNANEENDYR